MFNLSKVINPKFAFSLFASCSLLVACGGGSTDAPKPTDAPAKPAAQTAATKVPATLEANPTTAPAAVAPSSDPKEAVVAAMKKQLKSGPYRNKTTIVSDKSTFELTGEVIPPDRMHLTNTIAGKAMESIYIGDKGWTKIGGTWGESPVAAGQILAQISDSFVDEMVGTISDVKLVGPEDVNGTPTLAYTFNSDMNKATTMKMDSKSAVKIWIGVADGLVHKQELDSVALGRKSKTTQFVEYDATIKIEPPK